VEHAEFWDETFNANRKRLETMTEAIGGANINMTWSIRGAVVNHTPLDVLRELKKTGLKLMQFGVETSVPRLLRYLNKRMNPEKAELAFENCRKAGIRTVANMMLNLPGQTREEMRQDLSFLRRLRPTYVSISVYNWAPGTTLYEEALTKGLLSKDFWRGFASCPVHEAPVQHPEGEVPISEVYRMRDSYHFRHYFNPQHLFDYLRHMEINEIPQGTRIAGMMIGSAILRFLGVRRGN
jgi:radical SAM superfamily enzyme YgiQ (UPF0313 family)